MKTLERKIVFPTKKLAIKQLDENCMLIYKLTSGRSPIEFVSEDEHIRRRFFHISITKIDAGAVLEERDIYELACLREEAIEFFDTLVRNTVTPCTLGDIVEDFRLDHNIC